MLFLNNRIQLENNSNNSLRERLSRINPIEGKLDAHSGTQSIRINYASCITWSTNSLYPSTGPFPRINRWLIRSAYSRIYIYIYLKISTKRKDSVIGKIIGLLLDDRIRSQISRYFPPLTTCWPISVDKYRSGRDIWVCESIFHVFPKCVWTRSRSRRLWTV